MSADIKMRDGRAGMGLLVLLTAAMAGCGGVEPSEGDDGDPGEGAIDVGQSEAGLVSESVSESVSQSEVGLLSSAAPPRPSSWSIESVTTGGNGCPDGEVDVVVTPDQRAVLLTFSAMHLEYPPPPRVKRLNCVAGFSLKVPAGLQVGIAPVLTTGYADLSTGARVRLGSQYFIAGSAQRLSTDPVLEGPHHGRYLIFDGAPAGGAWISDRPPAAPTLWSGCGGSAILTVNTSITLNTVQSPAATAAVNTAGAGGAMQKVVQLVWKACS